MTQNNIALFKYMYFKNVSLTFINFEMSKTKNKNVEGNRSISLITFPFTVYIQKYFLFEVDIQRFIYCAKN